MKTHTDIITINGKHYSAHSGRPVASKVGGETVNDILPKHVVTSTLKKPPLTPKTLSSSIKKPVMDIARVPASNAAKHRLQPGQTLMRRALTKPSKSLKRSTKVSVPNMASAAVVTATVAPKISAAVIDSKKLRHALHVTKSNSISRFANVAYTSSVNSSVNHLAAAATSATVVTSQRAAQNLAKQPSMDIFERALANATGHQQKPLRAPALKLKKNARKKRFVNIAASSLATLLLIGFVGYSNLPNMKFQYASSKAGFHASLPSSMPAGFSLGKLSYHTGAVSVNFHSNSDQRSFAITQKPSAWDSQTLLDNFVAESGQQYHVSDTSGRTIYIYGNNNATWVSGGVWYNVQTNGGLSERQLTDLATSM